MTKSTGQTDQFVLAMAHGVDTELPSLNSVGMGQNGLLEVGFVADGYGSPGELNEVDAVIPGYGELSWWHAAHTHDSSLRGSSPDHAERG